MHEIFDLFTPPKTKPQILQSTSIFPQKEAFVVLPDKIMQKMNWSLLPRWVKDTSSWKKFATHNAMAETIEEKRMYGPPWKDGLRCAIPATYFVEWRGEKGKKEKLYIRPKDKEMFMLAGLYDVCQIDGKPFPTFTMLTTLPNEFMKSIHHRMPVVLDDWEGYLNPDLAPEEALDFLQPYSGILEITK